MASPESTNHGITGATVVEGDMVFPGAGQSIAAALDSGVARWPNGVVPYDVEEGIAHPERITKAVEHWVTKTGIRWVPRTNEKDYVHIFNGSGCWSSVGRLGGKQDLSINWDNETDWGCGVAEAIHEMGHAVGLAHEQSRADRDDFLEIHWENIEEANKYNFDKINFQSIGAYDIGSIMQYRYDAFSRNGQPTMTAKNGALPRENVQGLSVKDVEGVRALYRNELQGNNTDLGGNKVITIHWPMRTNTATYSLDVQHVNGSWAAPCIDTGILGRSLTTKFDGSCPSGNGAYIGITAAAAFRICSAEGEDWQHAICDTVQYTGGTTVDFR